MRVEKAGREEKEDGRGGRWGGMRSGGSRRKVGRERKEGRDRRQVEKRRKMGRGRLRQEVEWEAGWMEWQPQWECHIASREQREISEGVRLAFCPPPF